MAGQALQSSHIRPTLEPGSPTAETLVGVAILKPHLPREARVLAARSDVEALRRIQPVPLLEDDAEAGERLAAPADRRPCRMRAVLHFNRHADEFTEPGERGVGIR